MKTYLCKIGWEVEADSEANAQLTFVNDLSTLVDNGDLYDSVIVKAVKVKKHHLIPCEGGGRGINGHSAFACEINDIIIRSNNDIIGNKWYVDRFGGEGSETEWFPSPTACAIAYYDAHN